MKNLKNKKVVVAMSGGVDSSVAAFLLKKEGYSVTGIFMRLGFPNDKSEAAARQVCQKLGIKFYPVNLAAKFKEEIISYFLDSYKEGITPNPCVKCNRLIKFGELLRVADELGADCLATGHYVTKHETRNTKHPVYGLCRGKDGNKDQSYFLYTLTQAQLRRILFPLGDYTKDEIREIAARAGLPHLKGESQDVCFLNQDGKILEHNEYLKKYLKMEPGPIITLSPHPPLQAWRGGGERPQAGVRGTIIGKHQGLPLYTIGQRKGVEIGGTGPYYVSGMDYKTNTLYVVKDADDSALYRDNFIAGEVNWTLGQEPAMPLKCEAVIRYRHKVVGCTVMPSPLAPLPRLSPRARGTKECAVRLDESQRAVTPGQSVVFYKGDEVLGGGIIGIDD